MCGKSEEVFEVTKGKFVDSSAKGADPKYQVSASSDEGFYRGSIGASKWEEVVEKAKFPNYGVSASVKENPKSVREKRLERVRENNHVQLLLEGEKIPTVTSIRVRLVTDGERVVLELQPFGRLAQAVARLEVKDGKVVMYREQGVMSGLINTDSEGRIQN